MQDEKKSYKICDECRTALEREAKDCKHEMHMLMQKNETLTARAEKAERERDELDEQLTKQMQYLNKIIEQRDAQLAYERVLNDQLVDARKEAEEKLAAAKARIKKLEALLEKSKCIHKVPMYLECQECKERK